MMVMNNERTNSDADADLGELLGEVVELPMHWRLDLLGLDHGLVNLVDSGGGAGADDDTPGLAGGHVGAGEDDVLLVQLDGPGVGHGVTVLDDGDGHAGHDGLVDPGGRASLNYLNSPAFLSGLPQCSHNDIVSNTIMISRMPYLRVIE